jgi:hypothetical protein
MALSNVLFEVEHRGVQLDLPYLQDLEIDFEQDIERCRQEIHADVGYEFNIDSTDKLTEALLHSGCRLTKLTPASKKMLTSGVKGKVRYCVDKDVLEGLATTYPFAAKIQNYRLMNKLKNTYVVNLREMSDSSGYLHSTMNQNVNTGRMSSREPSIMNIPGRNISVRRAFITPLDQGPVDDWIFLFIDYGQVELRLTAHHSQDPVMLSCYPWQGKGIDIHTLTCAEVIMEKSYDEVMLMKNDFTDCVCKIRPICDCPGCTVKFFRNIAKRVNFGIIYGAGPGAIQRQVSRPERPVTKAACSEYIDKYFEKYQGVKEWIAVLKAFLRRHEYVQNTFGRYRRLPDIRSKKRWQQERAARQGVNFTIQGCKDADSFVMTDRGAYSLRTLKERQDVGDEKPQILTYSGFFPDYTVNDTGSKDLFEIETTHGTEFVTEDHRFFTYADSDFSLRKLSELRVGDFIVAMPNASHYKGDVPVGATEQHAELIGILCGDGSYTRDRDFKSYFGEEDLDWGTIIQDLVVQCYPQAKPRISLMSNSEGVVYKLDVTNKSARLHLLSLGLKLVSRDKKEVPSWLFSAPPIFREACLRGLFDSDGGVAGGGGGYACFLLLNMLRIFSTLLSLELGESKNS